MGSTTPPPVTSCARWAATTLRWRSPCRCTPTSSPCRSGATTTAWTPRRSSVGSPTSVLVSTGASDWVASSGTARKVDGGYVVSGRKAPPVAASTVSPGDQHPVGRRPRRTAVAARLDPLRRRGRHHRTDLGHHRPAGPGSHTVVLEDVFVPEAAVSLVRPADEWHPIWNMVVGVALPLIMAGYVGIADAAVDLDTTACAGRDDPATAAVVGEALNVDTTASDVLAAMSARPTTPLRGLRCPRRTDAGPQDGRGRGGDGHRAPGRGRRRRPGIRHAASPLERLARDVQGAQFHRPARARRHCYSGRVALGLAAVEAGRPVTSGHGPRWPVPEQPPRRIRLIDPPVDPRRSGGPALALGLRADARAAPRPRRRPWSRPRDNARRRTPSAVEGPADHRVDHDAVEHEVGGGVEPAGDRRAEQLRRPHGLALARQRVGQRRRQSPSTRYPSRSARSWARRGRR